LSSAFQRTLLDERPAPDVAYTLEDEVLWSGTLIGAGLSHRVPIGSWLGIVGRLTAGLASAQSAERIRGTAATVEAPRSVGVVVTGRDQVLRSSPGFLIPEIGAEAAWGSLHVGLTLGLGLFPVGGPRYGRRQIGVNATCGSTANGGDIECAPTSGAIASERIYGPFVVWMPQIALGLTFPQEGKPERGRGSARP
jgi:hypothetical protein